MNPSKTEFIYFGNQVQINKYTVHDIRVSDDLIIRSSLIKYLGAWLGTNMSFKAYITKKCQVAMCNFQRIKSIQHLLDDKSCANLCISLCMTHLDYSNSILYGLPESSVAKKKRVQNVCAHLTLRKCKFESPTECMYKLHWLPVRLRIEYKILILTYKCLLCGTNCQNTLKIVQVYLYLRNS